MSEPRRTVRTPPGLRALLIEEQEVDLLSIQCLTYTLIIDLVLVS